MSLSTLLSHWRADPAIASNISAWETIPRRTPQFKPLPADLDPALVDFLHSQKVEKLYTHQIQAWNLARSGSNLAVVTGTASGKSLAYQLPTIDTLLKEPSCRALYLFPTKALAHDQLNALKASLPLQAASYDGDTPKHHRKKVREHAQLVISNPDMLHLGILPHHTAWDAFFSNLRYVVVDEMHIYRGVFGSHVANVLRRLKRICGHYGSIPQFLLTSATIGNPRELAQTLVEEPVTVIDQDHSARGEKHFLIYNPPVIDEDLGLRAGMQQESVRLVSDLVSYQVQTILFARSRKSVEFMLTRLRESLDMDPQSLRAYRSGYLPGDRRQIEDQLRRSQVLAVVATTALELGIDIGGMGATVLAGYPGTIAGTWQQAGRSGRSHKPSLSILVTSSSPLDQFFAHHPRYLFTTPPEHALIDPDNLLILLKHIRCASFELPFSEGERYGDLSTSQTMGFLDVLEKQGAVHASQGQYYWMEEGYPASEISLRSASGEQLTLTYHARSGKKESVGSIDRDSALWMVHPGAIYLHEGEVFKVADLNLAENTVKLIDAQGDYYTEPEKQFDVSCLAFLASGEIQGGNKHYGELSVTTQVVGYKKFAWGRYEVLGRESLDLPTTRLETTGYWLTLEKDVVHELRQTGVLKGSTQNYGSQWEALRQFVLRRDHYRCQVCGKDQGETELHVHHRQPLRSAPSLEQANQPQNLITLCPRCHQRVESVVRVKSGLSGLANLLHHLSPLLLMCDRRDLGVIAEPESDLADGQPAIIIFEQVPAGVGFSKRLYERHDELMINAFELVSACPCQDGCPSCVGPGGELGSGGKQETQVILETLAPQ